MRSNADIAEIKALLQARAASLVPGRAPDGYRTGNTWIAKNPTRDDRKAGSFVIWIAGNAIGAWKDFAGDCEGPGARDKGDIVDLIRYCLGLAGTKEALAWARDYLGIAKMDAREKARIVHQAHQREAQADKERENDLIRYRKAAFAIWVNSWEKLACTPVDAYLEARGIQISALQRPARALRYAPNMEHHGTNTRWPCLVAGVYDLGGELIAVHRTWLKRDGSGKAPVDPARKIWPSFRGGFIPLARGASGLSHHKASAKGVRETLVLTEGIEDGLSVALACPEYRVWAACSLGNLMALQMPPCINEVILCADNDWGKPQAGKLLAKGIEALQAQKVSVRVARSAVGKDVNDALRGTAKGAA